MMIATVSRCEVPGCLELASQKHHIFTRGRHGYKALVPENEFWCCADHHTLSGDSWHNKGRDSFAEAHGLQDRVRQAERAVHERQEEYIR